jgi:hypothetical protein
MLCYRDMTFCQFYKDCEEGDGCGRALTLEVMQAAERWWCSPDAPIAQYAQKPKCYRGGDKD